MTVFDVFVNGRKVCRAGVGADGVLNAIVSWVKLTGPAAREARRLERPLEETRLHVGGLRGETHRRWAERDLEVGDRVTVAVARANRFDPPAREVPRDPQRAKRQERRYYLRLKRKFERPTQPSSKTGRRIADAAETSLLNVDLDIWSRSPLDTLIDAFGSEVIVLHAGREGTRHAAHLELADSGLSTDGERIIRRFVTLVKRLPRSARAVWNRAQIREFNVGIQAGPKPLAYGWRLDAATVDAAASVNARLAITVYGTEFGNQDRRPTKKRQG